MYQEALALALQGISLDSDDDSDGAEGDPAAAALNDPYGDVDPTPEEEPQPEALSLVEFNSMVPYDHQSIQSYLKWEDSVIDRGAQRWNLPEEPAPPRDPWAELKAWEESAREFQFDEEETFFCWDWQSYNTTANIDL